MVLQALLWFLLGAGSVLGARLLLLRTPVPTRWPPARWPARLSAATVEYAEEVDVDDVDDWGGSDADRLRLTALSAEGTQVELGPEGLTARDLAVTAHIAFADAAAQVGRGLVLHRVDDRTLGLTRHVRMGGARVSIRATASVTCGRGRLVIEPQRIDVGGPGWLSGAASEVARRLVTVRHVVRGLPDGLVLTAVTVDETGLLAELVGEDVSIGARRQAPPVLVDDDSAA